MKKIPTLLTALSLSSCAGGVGSSPDPETVDAILTIAEFVIHATK